MKKLVKENYNDYICNSKINEARFSEDAIKFEKADVYDKTQDALFYIKEIKDNLSEIDLRELKPDFKFDLAFEKLINTITRIAESTELGGTKKETKEDKFIE